MGASVRFGRMRAGAAGRGTGIPEGAERSGRGVRAQGQDASEEFGQVALVVGDASRQRPRRRRRSLRRGGGAWPRRGRSGGRGRGCSGSGLCAGRRGGHERGAVVAGEEGTQAEGSGPRPVLSPVCISRVRGAKASSAGRWTGQGGDGPARVGCRAAGGAPVRRRDPRAGPGSSRSAGCARARGACRVRASEPGAGRLRRPQAAQSASVGPLGAVRTWLCLCWRAPRYARAARGRLIRNELCPEANVPA